jgi:uncharacterized protein
VPAVVERLKSGAAVLRHTFVHGPGIGPTTEASIWAAGCRTWEEYLDGFERGRFVGARYQRLVPVVAESCRALERNDVAYFDNRLAAREKWRLYETFADRTAFVDIETTGLYASSDITVVAMHAGGVTRTFVRGRNLGDFPRAMADYPLVVTYNGAQFDLPFLARTFGGWRPSGHIDLRFPMKRLGYVGGLKAIEPLVGIVRPTRLRGMDGWEAVRLWQCYERGDRLALERLLEYARYDVENLRPLAECAIREMAVRVGFAGKI